MLKMFKNKKAQNTAEYAILIALVVGGVIAMQTYAQRALQGRIRDANVTFRDSTNSIGTTLQYEPYYSDTKSSKDKSVDKLDTYELTDDTAVTTTKVADYKDITHYNKDGVQDITTGTGVGTGL